MNVCFPPAHFDLRRAVLSLALAFLATSRLPAADLELALQTRDPATGRPTLTRESVDPSRVGVIAVDVWNYHWCKTATMRVDALVPRINRALEAARSLGMTVLLCPSDVVDNYVGFPQREAVLAMPKIEVPTVVPVTCPPAPDAGGCACGRERCGVNYGWDGMHPGLRIGDDDLMPDTQAEVYAICRQRGLTHLIYVGFHTQVCLLGKPMGLKAMKSAGLRCLLARDLTDAHPGYDPERAFTPDLNTAQVVEHFEKHLALSNGSNLARYPSVIFKVFIDGREAAASPVMRVQFPAWHFNVPLPPNSQHIALVAMDAGDGTREDFADWVNAGFMVGH